MKKQELIPNHALENVIGGEKSVTFLNKPTIHGSVKNLV
jgi:hypothetical protein